MGKEVNKTILDTPTGKQVMQHFSFTIQFPALPVSLTEELLSTQTCYSEGPGKTTKRLLRSILLLKQPKNTIANKQQIPL